MEPTKTYKYKGYLISEKRCTNDLTNFLITTINDNYLVSKFSLHDKNLSVKENFFDSQIESFEKRIIDGILGL